MPRNIYASSTVFFIVDLLYIAPEILAQKLSNPVNDFSSTLTDTEIEFLNKKILDIYKEGLLQSFRNKHYVTGLSTGIDALAEGMREH